MTEEDIELEDIFNEWNSLETENINYRINLKKRLTNSIVDIIKADSKPMPIPKPKTTYCNYMLLGTLVIFIGNMFIN